MKNEQTDFGFFFAIIACYSPEKKQVINDNLTIDTLNISISDSIPQYAQKLIQSYPDYIIGYENNYLIFVDSSKVVYDDKSIKSYSELLSNPDIEDQSYYEYNKKTPPLKGQDPGRIRNEILFKKMYGNSAIEVQKKLKPLQWCPKNVNQTILVTTANNVYYQLEKVSNDLDSFPEFKTYLTNIGGTFNWRKISGTDRLSAHSFGMTIDINTKYSNYWQWDCGCKNENTDLKYVNRIPMKIVEIFERHGFIWGGRWYHYDTMHFEYRPDLL